MSVLISKPNWVAGRCASFRNQQHSLPHKQWLLLAALWTASRQRPPHSAFGSHLFLSAPLASSSAHKWELSILPWIGVHETCALSKLFFPPSSRKRPWASSVSCGCGASADLLVRTPTPGCHSHQPCSCLGLKERSHRGLLRKWNYTGDGRRCVL